MEASSEQILLDRKDRLIAKLEQRNEERKVQTEECLSKSEGAQIDNLMAEIKSDLEAKKSVDSQKIDRLQEFLAFSTSNRQTKTIQNFLEDVRKQKLALNSGPKFKGFSFSVRCDTYRMAQQKTPKPAPPVVKSTEEPLKIPEIQKIPDCLSAEPSVSEHVVDGLKNTTKSISGTKGEDISLKNIDSCRLQFDFEPSIVHIRNIKNSTLIFLRCDRSLLIHDCDNVHIYVAAQQVRIHTSQNLHLHVATRGAVILEDSTKIFMYPYRLKSGSGELLNVEDNGEWRTPRDFNWLATTPSPNWKVVPEDEWTEEFIY